MLRLLATLTLLSLTTAITMQNTYQPKRSAASDSQISFAIENNYDDTGPGAKTREYAYKTYKHLEDALIGYIDDKDTKLPAAERNMAIERLKMEQPTFYKPIQRYLPKTVGEYTGYTKTQNQASVNLSPVQQNFGEYNSKVANLQALLSPSDFRPVNTVPRYTSLLPDSNEITRKNKYSYSYKVNDLKTGDQKAAQEIREGDTVRGFYTLLDADGSTRIVKYKADNDGFHAEVDRTESE